MIGTIRLADMALFAQVAEAGSFTGAARSLGIPKQTLSRRVSELERALSVQLLHRTTRRLRLTDVGAAYLARCVEMVRLAEDANRVVKDAGAEPSGLLRVTADPLFGEAFVAPLVIEYAQKWPRVQIEVLLTRRRVDLVEEGFDVAFRVGTIEDRRLTATRLGPATVRYCASPSYVRAHGAPKRPQELSSHECLVVQADGEPARWPIQGKTGMKLVPVKGRLRFNSFSMAYAAALAGLGIGLFPDFTCSDDLRRKRLVAVLEPGQVAVGAVWLVHPAERYLAARVRSFVALASARLGARPPWVSRD